jgi:class 3 adenylate cyclase
MATEQELTTAVQGIFAQQWDSSTKGTSVPEPHTLRLNANHGINLDATVLYADMKESTDLVDRNPPEFAAEIYKAYLRCAASIISSEGGEVTAYDGDRVMGVFLGNMKNTNAVRSALKINNAVTEIIQPLLKNQYPATTYTLNHTVGVDTSAVMAARTGIRKDNDIVWVGRAPNHAAKLCAADYGRPLRITRPVFDAMHGSVKTSQGQSMWTYEYGSDNYRGGVLTSSWWFAQWFNGDN